MWTRSWLARTRKVGIGDVSKFSVAWGKTRCFFQLDLPAYSSREILKERLLYAIQHAQVIEDEFAGAPNPNSWAAQPEDD